MQDKPIIINGIDVSECENALQGKNTILCAGSEDRALCDANTNCLYKKYKRKEQELEELRQYHNKCCTEFKNEKQALLEKYNQVSTNFYNGDYCNTEHCSLLNAKEQECERWKKANDEKNELLAKLGCPTVATARRLAFTLQQQIDKLKEENEKMSKGYSELTEIVSPYIDDFTGYNEKLGGFDIVLCVKELLQQLDSLKAQNDTYKKMLEDEDVRFALNEVRTGERHLWFNKAEKLEQTLIEIKDIAENVLKNVSDKCIETTPMYGVHKQILQKISEVLNEQ